MSKDYSIHLKNPEDSPEKIAHKLNTLTYIIEPHVINGEFVDRKEFNEFKKSNGDLIRGSEDRINYNIEQGRKKLSDQRYHGGGLSTVSHDNTLSGDGTPSSPLTVIGGIATGYQSPTGTVDGVNQVFIFSTAPNALVVDGVGIRKTASDGTVNWTGTTTVTQTIAPNFDIYSVA